MVTCTLTTSEGVSVVTVTGRLDLAGVAGVRTALHKALVDQPDAIVVDLVDLTVDMDVNLIAFSAFATFAAHWSGCPVALSTSSGQLRADLRRLGISRVVPVYPSR